MTENYHIIRDTVAPTISMSDVTIKDTEATSYNLMTGVSVADNSGVTPTVTTSGSLSSTPGTYTITYTVRDAAGNVKTASRNITVEKPYDPNEFAWTGHVIGSVSSLNFDQRHYGRETNIYFGEYIRSYSIGYTGASGTVKRDSGVCQNYGIIERVIEDDYGFAYIIIDSGIQGANQYTNIAICPEWTSNATR